MNSEKEKWVLLVVLTLIWGSSFILIKKGLEYYSPFEVGALRVLIAGIALSPLAVKHARKFPKERIKWLVLAAFSGNFIPMFLFPIAETEISSSVAGIINSMMPIFVIIVGGLFWKFQTSKKQIMGVTISFLGVCLIMLSSNGNYGLKSFPVCLLLIATFLYAVSVTTVKMKLSDIPAQVLSGFVFFYVLAIPSLLALAFSGFFSRFSTSSENLIGLGYISILSIFGTGLAMLLNYRLLKIANPIFASSVTLLMPIVAIIWGTIDGEAISFTQIFGGGIIITGLLFLRKQPNK